VRRLTSGLKLSARGGHNRSKESVLSVAAAGRS